MTSKVSPKDETRRKEERKELCQNCGKPSKEDFYRACSDECRLTNCKNEMNFIQKMMSKLPKVKLHL